MLDKRFLMIFLFKQGKALYLTVSFKLTSGKWMLYVEGTAASFIPVPIPIGRWTGMVQTPLEHLEPVLREDIQKVCNLLFLYIL
ncbi:hypothetical protein GW17_00042093 [Ensete ventricosum]|nr:hypothetical protein GW17_00042093 [Ensete ventricosum]